MRFYNQQHRFYCGVDLHARTMYLCILDQAGQTSSSTSNLAAPSPTPSSRPSPPSATASSSPSSACSPGTGSPTSAPQEQIPFVLGHALYMKAIHGGKTKNDQIDADKIARLLRGGIFPHAYVYPQGMRETRDLLRRRTYLVHKRAELITHLQNTNSQYNLPPFGKKLVYAANRAELEHRRALHRPQRPAQSSTSTWP